VYLWNAANNGYYGPLPSNGYDQQISFEVIRNLDLFIDNIEVYQILMAERDPITIESNPHGGYFTLEVQQVIMG
jgi:hypothetical protein